LDELTCDDLEANLDDFLEGKLPRTVVEAATRHVAECEQCRVTLDETEQVRDLGATHGRLTLAPDARRRILDRLDSEQT